MIPAEFDYVAVESLEEAINELHQNGEDAKLLAGGHSLIPLMKLRLAAPSILIDLRKVPGLHGVERQNGHWRIGALTPHAVLERSPELGLVSQVAATIADPQVRNRGTIGGSLAHGDPASDLPAAMLLTEAEVTLQGQGGQRTVAAADLFRDYLETAVEPGEVLTEIRLSALDGWGHGYQKFNRRSEDWAMVAVSAVVKESGGVCEDVRIGLTNMASVPLRATAVEEALRGQELSAENIAKAAEQAADETNPPADLNASADYKRHLAQVLCKRALYGGGRSGVNPAGSDSETTVLAEIDSVESASAALAAQGYLADRQLALAVRLAVALSQPLLLEGEAGVGKTEVARALAAAVGARLIRLQCHEGIDLHHAVYDWDYARQLLALRAAEGGVDEGELFARRFLLRRPLLEAIEADPAEPVVLLIDEIDRADDEFEAFLLEFLSDFAVTIPELGTISARRAPIVLLTSNRTRELHDALKRRCLYHWIDYPSAERERAIVHSRLPDVPERIAARVVAAVGRLREQGDLYKLPGVGETIVWAQALLALGDEADLEETLGAALKVHEDVLRVRERKVLEGV